jgi:tripartite-type tricarboxylate transporter receptor subunit TctC
MSALLHRCAVGALLPLLLIAATGAGAAGWPDKPVQVLADSAAGATPDVALRFVTDALGKTWGQQVIVVNKPGAGGSVAARAAADASPDGYTLYQPVLSTFVALHPAAANVPLHVPKDFLPIGFVAENPMFIAVSPQSGIKSLADLIARAKKDPGKITYATTGIGRLTHLAGELLQHEAGIKLLLVPYTGGPSHAVADVATGRVDMIIEGYSGIAGPARSGQIKLIATAAARRLAEFPDVPTVSETMPGFEATGWAVMVAPLGTPQPIIDKVSADLKKATQQKDVQDALAKLGSYVRPMSAAEATAFVDKQQKIWQPVLTEITAQQAKAK